MDVIERGYILSAPHNLGRTGIDDYFETAVSGPAHNAVIDYAVSFKQTFYGIAAVKVRRIENLVCISCSYFFFDSANRQILECRCNKGIHRDITGFSMDVIERGYILPAPHNLGRTGIYDYFETAASGPAHDAVVDNAVSLKQTFYGIAAVKVRRIENLVCISCSYFFFDSANRQILSSLSRKYGRCILLGDIFPLGSQRSIGIEADFIPCIHI